MVVVDVLAHTSLNFVNEAFIARIVSRILMAVEKVKLSLGMRGKTSGKTNDPREVGSIIRFFSYSQR